MKNRSEIVKYPPWNYVNGCYIKDEWTDYSDIGKIFESAEKLLNQDEMLLYGKPISKEEVDSFFNLMKAGIDMIKVKR